MEITQPEKGIYKKPTANTLHDERLNAFLLRSGARQICPLLPLLLNIAQQGLVRGIRLKMYYMNE